VVDAKTVCTTTWRDVSHRACNGVGSDIGAGSVSGVVLAMVWRGPVVPNRQ